MAEALNSEGFREPIWTFLDRFGSDFGVILGQNRTHARVLAQFHLQNRAHARVSAIFQRQKVPKRARERISASGIALKRARECDSDV